LADTLSVKLEQDEEKYKKFWHNNLQGIERVDLKFLKSSKKKEHSAGELIERNFIKELRFNFGGKELSQLNQIKRRYLITPYVYGQCIMAIILSRYANIERLALSYPLAVWEGIDFVYGAQINTNVVPYQINSSIRTTDLLRQGKEFFKSIKQREIHYGYYPITKIVQTANPHIVDISFIQTNLRDTPFNFHGITKVKMPSNLYVDSVPIRGILFEQETKEGKLNYRIRYDGEEFDEKLMDIFVDTYKRIFIEVLEDLILYKLIEKFQLL
jgi:hypothetical protein